MLVSSSGIVLSTLRYSDSSVIARIYTQQNGLRSFMVRTGKGKNALGKLGLLQPLSLIQVSYSMDERKNLLQARTIERETPIKTIPFNPIKSCIAMFVAEVVGRSIKEEEANQSLFNYLRNSILLLDDNDVSPANFHLKFMLEFTRFLGFYPESNDSDRFFFDLSEGEFVATEPVHPYFIERPLSEIFDQLHKAGMSAYEQVKMTNEQRRLLLQKLIDYYRLHLDGMKEIKSHRVLEEVLS